MPLPANLKLELRQMLQSFAAAHGGTNVPKAAGKALEAWLILRLATHARSSGQWAVTLRRGDGSILPSGQPFKLPGHQAGILKANPAGPGFVLFEKLSDPSISLELHGGLQWVGRSDATHECDVSLVPSYITQPLRLTGGHPRGLPIAAFECKDKTSTGNTDEMRETLARMFDLALVTQPYKGWPCRIFEAKTHRRWGRRWQQYRWLFNTGAFGIVRVGKFSLGAKNLGHHFHVGRFAEVYSDPMTIGRVEAKFLSALNAIHPTHGI